MKKQAQSKCDKYIVNQSINIIDTAMMYYQVRQY